MGHIGDVHHAIHVVCAHALHPFPNQVRNFIRRSHGDKESVADRLEIESTVRVNDAFATERFVLERFSSLKPIKAMLGGA